MSENPSESPSYASPPLGVVRTRLSATSVVSLILGILLCIPLVTSLAAILFAIAGFRATRRLEMRGRGLAIAGLILGIVGVVIWTGIGGIISVVIVGSQAPRAVLHDFANNIASGNIKAATAQCDSSIPASQLDTVHAYVAPFGKYSDLTCFSVNLRGGTAGSTYDFSGIMYFASGSHPFTAVLLKNSAGNWKILGFHVR